MSHGYTSIYGREPGVDAERASPKSTNAKRDWRGRSNKRILFVSSLVGVAIVLSCIIYVLDSTGVHSVRTRYEPAFSLEELRNGTYAPRTEHYEWLPEGKDGQHLVRTAEGYAIAAWSIGHEKERLIAPYTFKDKGGKYRFVNGLKLNRAQTHALLITDSRQHWRHSKFSRAWIINVETQDIKPLTLGEVSIVEWSPDGDHIVFVQNNNIYLYDVNTERVKQITHDGGEGVFNGIPDWVYEEEVLTGDTALWWSPSSQYVAFLRTNDTSVPSYPIPFFSQKSVQETAYPEVVEIKYPKPGYPNPSVEVRIFDVSRQEARAVEIPTNLQGPIFTETLWVGDELVVKIMDRQSDFLEVWIINPQTRAAFRSRQYSSEELGGSWFEVTHNSCAVNDEGYIDTIDVDGNNHLAYFSPANSSTPRILTSGDWEVQDEEIAVNSLTRTVYFHAAKSSSMEVEIFAVKLDDSEDVEPQRILYEGRGVHSAKFSPGATHVVRTFTGPMTPLSQKVTMLPTQSDTSYFSRTLEANYKLKTLLEKRGITEENVIYGTVDLDDGVTVNYREIRPRSFNPAKKHPLLFYNYGGPNSQQVKKALSIDFQRVYAEQHNAVVVTVDPRGTANRGRKFRASVRDHLGEHEADDVIAVAKIWNEKKYIDSETTAIWGWSYGGFLTLKVLERDTDLAFKYGVAVAPVTDWSLYDSIYTERYMHTPQQNPDGYSGSRIHDVKTLAAHNRFLIMHGTGDDNVHFQNTLRLLDALDQKDIENYDVHIFPDSDHSIRFHNANKIVFDKVNQWLSANQSSNRRKHRLWS